MTTDTRYFVNLPRYSSPNFTMLPDTHKTTKEHTLFSANQWMLELLVKSAWYYSSQKLSHPYLTVRSREAGPINEMTDWMDAQPIYYHYEFVFEQASKYWENLLVNPNTFDTDPEFWNYFKFNMRLYIPQDRVAIVKLYFPHIKIEKG